MSKKLGWFLFGCMAALGSAFAQADAMTCEQICVMKYNDCLTKPWLPAGLCSSRFQACIAPCDGGLPG